ncbi:MAG: RagB/SusD family nutrient uptake outer membrane protein [Tannerella sp.]|jgi:hypothetical protein|nr:RagB/SusD family nutrient uptake outer membrane protein [Tannerella sp.]
MKKIFLIITTVILMFTSCSDVLEQAPLHTPDVTTFWKSESDAQMALNTLYSYLTDAYGFWRECYSDNAIMTNAWGDGGMGEIKQGNLHPAVGHMLSNSNGGNRWKYDEIHHILYFLENLQNVPFDSESVRNRMEGEARFILAMKYFYLARQYGDVPLVREKPLTLEESRNIGKSPRREVFDYAVENLDKAIAWLPDVKDKSGKITRYAALCMKTEVLMWLACLDQFHGQRMSDKSSQQLWREAASAIQGVIQSGEYRLEDDFVKLFESSTNNLDDETILARQYVENEITNVTNLVGIPGGVSLRGVGWASFSAPRDLVDDYECVDGKTIYESPLYDFVHPWENRDKRLKAWYLLPGEPVLRANGAYTPFQSHPDYKVTNQEAIGGEGGGGRSGYWCIKGVEMESLFQSGFQNWIIYRYGEALLFLAESLNECEPANDSIRWAMDEIRIKRGGLPSVAPLLGNQAEMRAKIFHERRVEMVMEDKRYWDLLRTKQAEIYMNPPGNVLYGVNASFQAYQDSCGHWACEKIIAEPIRFDATKGYVWPVPQSVMDNNANITQSDPWK